MSSHLLSRLASTGVLEYARSHGSIALRASPRFLAHAEQVAARLGTHRSAGTVAFLEAALASWGESGLDLRVAAAFLADFMGERNQLGALRPVFPPLEHFAAA